MAERDRAALGMAGQEAVAGLGPAGRDPAAPGGRALTATFLPRALAGTPARRKNARRQRAAADPGLSAAGLVRPSGPERHYRGLGLRSAAGPFRKAACLPPPGSVHPASLAS